MKKLILIILMFAVCIGVVNAIAPVMNSSRITPNIAYFNDTLIGYCNATDDDSNYINYFYRWYKNDTLLINNSYFNNYEYTIINGLNRPIDDTPALRDGFWQLFNITNNNILTNITILLIGNVNPSGTITLTSKIKNLSDNLIIEINQSVTINFTSVKYVTIDFNYSLLEPNKVYNFTIITPNFSMQFEVSNDYYSYESKAGYGDLKFKIDTKKIGFDNATEQNVYNISSLHKGENYTLSCLATDLVDNSSWLNSSTLTISNTPPTFNQSNFNYNISHKYNISLQINASDFDNDLLNYSMTILPFFFINQTGFITKENNISTIGNYNATINVTDDINTTSMWIFFHILNEKSNVTVLNLTPLPAFSTNNISFTNTTIDNDNDNITNWSILWYINNILNSTNNNQSILNSTYINTNDNITVSLSVFDGYEWSDYFNSTTLTIGDNIAPNITNGSATPISGEIGNTFDINVNITEENMVSWVLLETTDPTLTKINTSMTLSSGVNNNGTYTDTLSGLIIGTYTFKIFAQDGSGNLREYNATATYTVTAAPIPPSGGGGGGGAQVANKKECNIVFADKNIRLLSNKVTSVQFYNNESISFSPSVKPSISLLTLKYTVPTATVLAQQYGEINLIYPETVPAKGTITISSSECNDIVININSEQDISEDYFYISHNIFGYEVINIYIIITGLIIGLAYAFTSKSKLGTKLFFIILIPSVLLIIVNLFFS